MDHISPAKISDNSKQAGTAGYASSREHLQDHLMRLALLAEASVVERALAVRDGHAGTIVADLALLDVQATASRDEGSSGQADDPATLRARAAEFARNIARREAATSAAMPLRLMTLCRLFAIDDDARDLLLIALMPDIESRHRRLFGQLAQDLTRERPLVYLAFDLLMVDPARGRHLLHPESPLLAWRLLATIETTSSGNLSESEVSVDGRIIDFLLENDGVDPKLTSLLQPLVPSANLADLVLPESVSRAVSSLIDASDLSAALLLIGHPGTGKRTLAGAMASALGRRILIADVGALLRSGAPPADLIRRTLREALLQNAVLAWHDLGDLTDHAPEKQALLEELLEALNKTSVPVWLLSSETIEIRRQFRDRPLLRLELPLPNFATGERLWRTLLSNGKHSAIGAAGIKLLANGFQLPTGRMRDAIAYAEARAALRPADEQDVMLGDLFEGCRNQSSHGLQALAQRIEPPAGLSFDDLVLPEDVRQQVEELRARIRLRGKIAEDLDLHRRLMTAHGLIALFSGPSGTGKTMTASLLALEQGVALYRIDLAAIVSKWVGETEKNLDRILREAESANAILFFDEADSLFGKRGEISQGQDRWANLELNFLLQRIEEYRGVAILATNLPNNIDEAFLRRLHVMIDFPFPDAAAREKIWRGLFPKGVGRPEDAALRALAERFPIAGGHIRNIVLAALFQALDRGDTPEVTRDLLALALAREHQKLGRPITKSSFGKDLYDQLPESLRS
jgi:AAA+ superfamily predicted ATPase